MRNIINHLQNLGLPAFKGLFAFMLIVLSVSAVLAETEKPVPFAFADFSWTPGGYAPIETPIATKYFSPELRLDNVYHHSFNLPADNTISGSSQVFRHGEFQTTQIGVGGDVTYKNVGFRLMTQFGMYSTVTPHADASVARGQWNLGDAYRYISEAYASYHLDVMNGINIQSGLFLSYVGLWSYYGFDNWTYQPSFVSSNTPWYFNGVRIQIFPTERLKLEFWATNGWQSYGRYNDQPGVGMQTLYRPTDRLSFVGNQYFGADTLGTLDRKRVHTDESAMVKYLEDPKSFVSKGAFSITVDAGCEEGGGVSCGSQYVLGFMAYNRLWFSHDTFALTTGGGWFKNPGRYLVLIPPVNGANAVSGTPYFSTKPGDPFSAWDIQTTLDYMPNRNVTFRLEYNHRQSEVPYFSGRGGLTPPGGNRGAPGSTVSGWNPDFSNSEDRLTLAMMIRI